MSGCVGRGPSALLCPGAYNAAKMALQVNNTFSPVLLFCRQILNWHFVTRGFNVNEPSYWILEIQHVTYYNMIENKDIAYLWNNFHHFFLFWSYAPVYFSWKRRHPFLWPHSSNFQSAPKYTSPIPLSSKNCFGLVKFALNFLNQIEKILLKCCSG